MLKKGEDVKLKLEEVQKLTENYGEPDIAVQSEFIAIDQQLELLELTLQRGEQIDADLTFTLEKKCESYQEKMMKKTGNEHDDPSFNLKVKCRISSCASKYFVCIIKLFYADKFRVKECHL